MLTATVEEAAKTFGVTPKAVHGWVREGMPTHKVGARGAGNRTMIDMARAPSWLKKHQRSTRPSITEFFDESGMPPNPLRWVAERAFAAASQAAGLAAYDWFTTPRTDGQLAWKRLGLTEAQARALVFEWWGLSAMCIYTIRDHTFESKWIEPGTKGANLDDFASILFDGDVRSHWREGDWPVPECIQPFHPLKDSAG